MISLGLWMNLLTKGSWTLSFMGNLKNEIGIFQLSGFRNDPAWEKEISPQVPSDFRIRWFSAESSLPTRGYLATAEVSWFLQQLCSGAGVILGSSAGGVGGGVLLLNFLRRTGEALMTESSVPKCQSFASEKPHCTGAGRPGSWARSTANYSCDF